MMSLEFIDMTIYGVVDMSTSMPWRNDEVLQLLRDIRGFILEDVEPPLIPVTEVTA